MAITKVRLPNQIQITNNVDWNAKKITNLADPTNPQDAATKVYVDNAIQGLDYKASVRCATTENIATLSGLLTVDGITVVAGDRVLVKNQTDGIRNGIYSAASGAWTRAIDMPDPSNAAGVFVFVEEGATQADTGWVCSNDALTARVGTDALIFIQFSSAGIITAGPGLVKTGNVISLGLSTGTTTGFLKKTDENTWTLDTNTYSTTSHNHTLDSLSNVTITSNSAGEILKWNGSAWINNTLSEAGIQPAGSYALTTGTLAQFATTPTTSAQLAGIISDETGSGSLVFATSPTLVTPILGVATATSINKVTITAPSTSATLTIANGATLTVNGSATIINGTHSGTNTGDQTISLTGDILASGGTGALATTYNNVVPVAKGGTNISSYAVGDLLCASAATTLSKIADVATGNALISGGVGVIPGWGKIGLTTHVSGILPIGNGGTNSNATPTAGGVAYGTGSAYAFTAVGTSGQVLTSNAGSAPSWTTIDMSYLPDSVFKKSVKAATTANITLSGTQTIDGIALVANDRVLVKDQSTASANGIYAVNASSWTRVADADSAAEIAGAVVSVDQGTVNGGKLFTNTFKTTDTLGTTSMTWDQVITDASQTQKYFFAAPNGANGRPVFRAIVASDIPTLNQNTTGSAATLTTSRTIAISGGVTGTATGFNGSANISIPVTSVAASYLSGTIPSTNLTGAFVFGAELTGTLNGTNPTFTLPSNPSTGTVTLYVNGIRQKSGSGNDYTISGSTITFEAGNIPLSGDVLTADYIVG